VTICHARAFQALFAAVDRGAPGHLAASGGLGDRAVDGDPLVAAVADRDGSAGGAGGDSQVGGPGRTPTVRATWL